MMKGKFGTFILSALYFYRFRVIPIYLCKIYVVVVFVSFEELLKKNFKIMFYHAIMFWLVMINNSTSIPQNQ